MCLNSFPQISTCGLRKDPIGRRKRRDARLLNLRSDPLCDWLDLGSKPAIVVRDPPIWTHPSPFMQRLLDQPMRCTQTPPGIIGRLHLPKHGMLRPRGMAAGGCLSQWMVWGENGHRKRRRQGLSHCLLVFQVSGPGIVGPRSPK